jgi:hypothetical protein
MRRQSAGESGESVMSCQRTRPSRHAKCGAILGNGMGRDPGEALRQTIVLTR